MDRQVIFYSEALVPTPQEGAQVLAGELAAHLSEVHAATTFGAGVSRRTVPLPVLRAIRRTRARHVVYLPQSGLTFATVVRLAVLWMALRRGGRLEAAIVQVNWDPPRWLRRLPWRWLAAGAQVGDRLSAAGLHPQRLSPRLPPAKISAYPSRQAAAQALGFSKPVFLHVGHLTPERNLDPLFALADGERHVVLIASGYGDGRAPLEVPEGNLTVKRGFVSDLADYYRAADVYVFPTVDPAGVIGLPMSIFEALANGTPVAARSSAMLDDWRYLDGLHLAETDAALREVAADLVGADKSSQGRLRLPGPQDCSGDLEVCADG